MKKWMLNLIVMFFCISAYGQDSLSLYLSMAAKNNPAVLQKFTEYKAALQKVLQVGSLPDPELNVGVFLSPMELIGGNQVADIKLMQMFPWFGVLKNAKDEMSLMAKAKFESFRDAKLQTFYNVQRTWYELQKVKQNIRITEKNIELLKTVERISLVKFRVASIGKASAGSSSASPAAASGNSSGGNSGMNSMGGGGNSSAVSPSTPPMGGGGMGSSASGSGLADIYRIQMERGELENSLALLHSQEQTIVARFNSYLNRPVTTGVITPDKLVVDSSDILPKTLSDSLFSGNPMLGMLLYEQQSAEARKKMVTKMGYPMVGVGLNYSLINKNPMSTSEMNGKDMVMPMVTVTLPIYRKKYKAMQNEAELMKTASQQGYQATANALNAEYYEAMQLYQDAARRIKLYANQTALAQKSLDITIKSFSASGAGLTELLSIRRQQLDYEQKQIEAIADYNTAVAWIKRLVSCGE
ncbi:TolC family protein [Parabacteroides sp. FAFU027]|uniref:TolC family protein n=1 Tax=Parabacteroides sp. FAFU027 TaxID=2922715 RepID=UPI001FAFF665|nr:TolC family protein [Parabacteroides sp. FAFU027]